MVCFEYEGSSKECGVRNPIDMVSLATRPVTQYFAATIYFSKMRTFSMALEARLVSELHF